MGKLSCARQHSVQISVQFLTQLNCTVQLRVYAALKKISTSLLENPNLVSTIKSISALSRDKIITTVIVELNTNKCIQ
jgi:hypothetical protein